MKKILISLLATLLILSGCVSRDSGSQTVSTDVTAQFETYQQTELINYLSQNKLTAHYTVKDLKAYGLEDMEATMGSQSEDFDFTSYEESLTNLKKIQRSKLSSSDQNIYDRYEKYLETQIAYKNYEDYYFYFTPGNGLNVNLITNFTEFVIYNEQDIKDIITYIGESKTYLEDCITYTKNQKEKGIEQSAETMQGIIDYCQKVVDSKGSTAVATSVNAQITKATYLSDEEKTDYQQQVSKACDESLIPAYQEIIDYFTEAKKTTTSTGSLASWNDGKKYYALLLKDQTSSSLTPKEAKKQLIAFIDDEVSELQSLYQADPSAYPDTVDYGYTDPNEILSHLKEAMTNDFPTAADVNYTISYLDSSVASDSIAAYYVNPTIDDFVDNVIKVNANASNDLFTTLAHEGYPGHCYQITYELANNYSPLLGIMSYIGYAEGWAVYVESFGIEYSKITNQDTIDMLSIDGVLFYQVMSVVDIMVNYEGADADTVEEFVSQYYGSGNGESLYQAVIDDPGLYLPYGVGYMEMKNLETTAQKALGDKFNYKDYHTVILNAGSCDYDYLKKQVNNYIKANN